jgi:hypothetical protein
MTVIGALTRQPRPYPTANNGGGGGSQVALIELELESEMNSGLPKGLPNLGKSRVVVICNQKQWNKVKDIYEANPLTRLIIEGEPTAAIRSDFTPFLKVICVRLTSVEQEQAARPPTSTTTSGE